jgi:imidazoleglycerol-phosphate dehydratase
MTNTNTSTDGFETTGIGQGAPAVPTEGVGGGPDGVGSTYTRKVELERKTAETHIRLTLDLDGSGEADVQTGLGFLDHMLTSLARHGKLDLTLTCTGDLDVDDHHTAEDCALLLGQAIDEALGERRGIQRFGSAYAPLDEALARVVLDLSGRPFSFVDLGLRRDSIGSLATENITHVFQSLATTARATLHLHVLRGENDHHRAEAAFKALALALRQAVARDGSDVIPSTKEVL